MKTPEIKFGTSGWRGIIGDDFTSENLAIVAQAIANYLKKSGRVNAGIIAGYDTRFMSDRFAKLASGILSANNIPVMLTKRDAPTPVIAYSIVKYHTLGGLNITASHNPPEYNGIKFSTSHGGPASDTVTKGIEKEITAVYRNKASVKHPVPDTKIRLFDPSAAYLKRLSEITDIQTIKKSKLKISIDCLYGTLRGYLDRILRENGVIPHVIHDFINPSFNGGSPDPSNERQLTALKEKVKNTRSNLGLAADGDADRFGVVDSDGTYIPANHILPLIFEHLLQTRPYPGGIVRSMTTTRMLDTVARKFGRPVYEVPVGFKYVGAAVEEYGAIMGCEESSGMTIFNHVPEKDGVLACLLIAELRARGKQPIKKLLKEFWGRYGRFYSNRVDIRLDPDTKTRFLTRLKKTDPKKLFLAGYSECAVLPGDNIKVTYPDSSWIMIRPSGTEPLVRCYVEATSPKKLSALEKNIRMLFHK